MLAHARPVEPQPCVAGDPVQPELLARLAHVHARVMPIPCSTAPGSVTLSAVAVMYTPCPVPGSTVESNTTLAICGRTAMLCEWRAPGSDTQSNRR
jgi:hypothetical protein